MRKQLLSLLAATAALTIVCLQNASAQDWTLNGNGNAAATSKLGTTNAVPLRLFTNNAERIRIEPSNGNVGINNTSPIGRLTVQNNGTLPSTDWVTAGQPLFAGFGEGGAGSADYILSMASNSDVRSVLIGRRSRGTLAAPAVVQNNDFLFSFLASGYDGSAFQNPATIDIFVDGVPSNGNVPARISFVTGTNIGNRQERLKVGSTGNFTFNDNQMFLNASNDRVGLGTTAPERRLHVFNGSAGFVTSNANAQVVVENNANNYINMLAPNANESGILFGNINSAQDGGIIYLNSTDAMQFRTNGNTTRMTLSNAGNLDITGGTLSFGSVETLSDAGVNTIGSNSNFVPTTDNLRDLGSPSLRWDEVWATDGSINTSDAREKTNIRDLDYGLKEIMQLRSTRFNWKSAQGKGDKIGLIAQELKKVLPEVVRDWEYKQTTEDGPMEKVPTERMGVLYSDIIPVLIKGMQEQQQQIEELKKEISQLRGNVTYTGAGSLSQAAPNPARTSTRIGYTLPSNSRGQLLLTDAAGKAIKAISLNGSSGYVDLNTVGLAGGAYNYSLMIDGKFVETKKFTVVR